MSGSAGRVMRSTPETSQFDAQAAPPIDAMATPVTRAASGGQQFPVQRVPHTQVHILVRRILENLQDVIASLLIVLLFILSLQAIWKLAAIALAGEGPISEVLSQILFVLILTELYRLMIFYLREHRVSVALTVEVALVSTLREIMLKGAYEFDAAQTVGICALLIVLGALLAMERWNSRLRNEISEGDAG